MTISRTIGIYLAAGPSTRMGTDQRLPPFSSNSLGSTASALQEAVSSALSHLLVIVPMADSLDWVAPDLLKHEKCTIIRSSAANGQADSFLCGLRQAIKRHAEAIVLLWADQPFMTKESINELIRAHCEHRTDYVAFAQQKTPLPPILFSASIFADLLDIRTGEEAKEWIDHQNWNGMLLPIG